MTRHNQGNEIEGGEAGSTKRTITENKHSLCAKALYWVCFLIKGAKKNNYRHQEQAKKGHEHQKSRY